MKKLLVAASILTVFLGATASAQVPPPSVGMPPDHPAPPPPRIIAVSGESHAEFVPDQAILSISLVNKDKNLSVAKKANDSMTEKLVNITHQLNIPKEKIATSNVSISPEYRYDNSNNSQQFVGYSVNRSLRITTDAADVPEKLLSAVVEAKIDQVEGIEYSLSEPEAHAAALRLKAFDDAKAKAEALAKEAGAKLGPVLEMSIGDEAMPMPPRRPMPMMRAMSSMAAPSVAPSLPGMIDLHESVAVTFALE